MKTLGGFLQKLQGIIPREVKVKNIVIECVSGIYDIQLSKSNIQVSGFTVSLQCPSQVKQIIHSKRDILIECVTEKLGHHVNIL